MALRFALGGIVACAYSESDSKAYSLLMSADECGPGAQVADGGCALELLQLSARELVRSGSDEVAKFQQRADRKIRQLPAPRVPNREQWPELYTPEAWSWDVPVPVKVVAWTGQFYMSPDILHESVPDCTFEFLSTHKDVFPFDRSTADAEFITTDADEDISDADVVLFYLPYLKRNKVFPSHKRDGQLWIATCGEPVSRPATQMDCSLLHDEETMSYFDGVASYHSTSEFPTFQDPPYEDLMRQPAPRFEDRGPELATMAFSDCKSAERGTWLGAIKAQFDERGRSDALLSYGKCFHNAEEPEVQQCAQPWHDLWTNRCASRPFKLVAENTVSPWYITEKIWDAFVEGAIPVYMGPEDIKELVPPNSILFAGDYASPEALADAMLDFSDADFARFREWKQQPVSEWGRYAEARKNSHYTLLPRLCEAGAVAKVATEKARAIAGR